MIAAFVSLCAALGLLNAWYGKHLQAERRAFLRRAREVAPQEVAFEYDARLTPWRFWRWAANLDRGQISDPELIDIAARLRRLKRRLPLILLLNLALLAFGFFWLIRFSP
jgi:hypothetical protein